MVCAKCSNPSGALKCSKCKVTTYCNRECQVAHWPTHKQRCKPTQMSPQKLELTFTVGRNGAPILFKEDIPALLCQRDCPRELSSRWVSNLVDTMEMEVLSKHAEGHLGGAYCLYCEKPATCLHTAVMITLHADPPTVRVPAQPLCSKRNDCKCALAAQKTFDDGINDPNGPVQEVGAEVYKV